ncbi:integral membrane protein [Rutstroemia sp. NJR-2017a WRK4]|nr:integral membrane protein [Rutstroemia sp. NJR-2017a WRK4]
MTGSVDLSATRQPSLYAADIITFILAALVIGLRLWSRRASGAGLWLDDIFICVAMANQTVEMALIIFRSVQLRCWRTSAGVCLPPPVHMLSCALTRSALGIPRGYGKHSAAFDSHADYFFFLGFFMAELIYTIIIVFVKYSILALYLRLFRSVSVKWPVGILAAIVTAWGIAVLFLSIFTCVPPKGFSDKSIDASCNVNSQQFLFGISIPNIITDVALLVLPIPYVLQLNSSWSQKRLLIGTFFLGGFVHSEAGECFERKHTGRLQLELGRPGNLGRGRKQLCHSVRYIPPLPYLFVPVGSIAYQFLKPACQCYHANERKYQLVFLPCEVSGHAKKIETSKSTTDRPEIWTIGGSGPSQGNRKRKGLFSLGESLSTDTTHPFTTLHDPESHVPTNEVHVHSEILVHSESGGLDSTYPESYDMGPLRRG